MDYEKLYHLLFNAATDAIASLDAGAVWRARQQLVQAQQQAEELYLRAGEGKELS